MNPAPIDSRPSVFIDNSREIFVKKLLALLLLSMSTTGFAAGTTAWAVPTEVDVTYAGIMVYGAFGNPGGCTINDQFFVPVNTTQYKEILAMLMMAFATGKQVAIYVNSCETVGWYTIPSTTFGFMHSAGMIYVRN